MCMQLVANTLVSINNGTSLICAKLARPNQIVKFVKFFISTSNKRKSN
jgi:hypothetical protein